MGQAAPNKIQCTNRGIKSPERGLSKVPKPNLQSKEVILIWNWPGRTAVNTRNYGDFNHSVIHYLLVSLTIF